MLVFFRNYHNLNFTDEGYLRILTSARMCTLHQIINAYIARMEIHFKVLSNLTELLIEN